MMTAASRTLRLFVILVLLTSDRDSWSQTNNPGDAGPSEKSGKAESANDKSSKELRTTAINRGNASGKPTIVPPITGGPRTISVHNRNEVIEIKDTDGRHISITHTRSIAGQMETVEYQADDLNALKLKSPSAAALYSKYTAPVAAAPLAPLRIQFPPQGREQAGDPDLKSLDDELEPSRHGPRRIRVDLKDQRIEIHDGGGKSIRMRLVKVDGDQERTEEFVADGIAKFKEAYPKLFQIYEKYTGIRFDENSDLSK